MLKLIWEKNTTLRLIFFLSGVSGPMKISTQYLMNWMSKKHRSQCKTNHTQWYCPWQRLRSDWDSTQSHKFSLYALKDQVSEESDLTVLVSKLFWGFAGGRWILSMYWLIVFDNLVGRNFWWVLFLTENLTEVRPKGEKSFIFLKNKKNDQTFT